MRDLAFNDLTLMRRGGGGATPPSLFEFNVVNQSGAAPTAWPTLRVRINGGAWQTLAAAGLTVSSYDAANREIVITGFTGAETSVEFHNKQQQPGEPFNDYGGPTATTIDDLYVRHGSLAAPVNAALPGLPVNSTRASAPVGAVA